MQSDSAEPTGSFIARFGHRMGAINDLVAAVGEMEGHLRPAAHGIKTVMPTVESWESLFAARCDPIFGETFAKLKGIYGKLSAAGQRVVELFPETETRVEEAPCPEPQADSGSSDEGASHRSASLDDIALRAVVEGAGHGILRMIRDPVSANNEFSHFASYGTIVAGSPDSDPEIGFWKPTVDEAKPVLHVGRDGADSLEGYDAQDVIVYLHEPGASLDPDRPLTDVDTFHRFESGRDKITALDLSGNRPAVLPGIVLEEGAAFTGRPNEWSYGKAGEGEYEVSYDRDGNQKADYQVTVVTERLHANDFLFGEA